ncbi:MAG: outer membrane protein assembly factor BamA [Candidatus Coatesbacteria bacterium]
MTATTTGKPANQPVARVAADRAGSATTGVPSGTDETSGMPIQERIVRSIQIEGTVNVKPSDISARLKTRIGTLATREGLREDLRAIWEMGLFDDVTVEMTDVEGGARVTFVVKERPIVRAVRYVGAREFGDKDLKEKVTVKEGECYDPVRVHDSEDRLLRGYREKGYPDATVRSELVPAEKERGKMDLVITVNEGKKMHVEKILFTGNKTFPDSALRKVLKNKEAAFFFQSGLYLKDELEGDKGRLLEYYKDEGYQKARVISVEVLPGAKPEKVILKFTVVEGVPYTVKSIRLDGNAMFTEAELKDKLDLEPGAKLSQRRLDAGIAGMREMYTSRGYIYANIIPDFVFDDAKGEADVVLRFHEGDQAIVDRILIRGNEETKEKIILRELEPGLEPGKTFDTKLIRRSQENIYNLGFFEDVRVYTEPSFKAGRENLIFEVKERQTGTVSLGGGYSSQYGFVGFLQLTKANLFGLGIRISAEWEIGQKRRNLQLDYFDPWFLDTKISLGLGFWDTNRELPNTFEDQSTGGSMEFGYRFPNKRWKVALGYKYEVHKVSPLPGQTEADLVALGVSPKAQATSSPSMTVTYDTRDNIFDPLSGVWQRLVGQVAGGPWPGAGMKFLGGDTKFYKVTYDVSYFQPSPVKLLLRPSLALHGLVGRGWGFDGQDVPIFERFFLGGTDSIRGYPERELGPRAADSQGILRPTGGRAEVQFNAEVKWPLVSRVLTIAAPFYDAGYTWPDFPMTQQGFKDRFNSLATSAGFGIRLTVPGTIIVIRLDYGWGLTKEYNPPPNGKLHFNIGNIF